MMTPSVGLVATSTKEIILSDQVKALKNTASTESILHTSLFRWEKL